MYIQFLYNSDEYKVITTEATVILTGSQGSWIDNQDEDISKVTANWADMSDIYTAEFIYFQAL